jgi:NADPH-dependent 2,4-dienoyl-CoA reductase/sulfur reductase-like enzyme
MSDRYGLLVVGGGPAGLSAARGYRDAGGRGPVAIVAGEERMPYQRPPLTKELMAGDADEEALTLEPETWLIEQHVALVGGKAVALDPGAHTVTLSGGRCLEYERCVLATGAEPTRLPVPGCDDPGVRVIRSLDHVRELLHRLTAGTRVAVIGSGFIGCEIAASLRRRGHPVTLVSDEPAPNERRLGPEAAAEIAGWLREDGVDTHFGSPVDAIERDGDALTLQAGDTRVTTSVVVMASGVAPRGELAAAAGVQLRDGAIPTDSAMRTTLPDVLAAGDVCLAENATAGRPLHVEHWGDALGQGEVAGRSAAGVPVHWEDVPGFWSTIGGRTLKYSAWGDGFDEVAFERHAAGGFTAWYGRDGRVVGVLAHEADEDYERGGEQIAQRAPWSR